jgi:hypothetical protein
MAATCVMYPIVAALVASEIELGPDRQWNPANDKQRDFLDTVFKVSRAEVAKIPEIESICSKNFTTINTFLKDRGFSIQLDPFFPPDIGMASVLKLAIEWLEKGTAVEVPLHASEATMFPAVRLVKGLKFLHSAQHTHDVLEIATKTGDVVYLTATDSPIVSAELAAFSARLLGSLGPSSTRYSGAVFPMVDLDHSPDISWLCMMSCADTDGNDAQIVQALQQTKFAMDEYGAKVESAVAIRMTRCAVVHEEPFVIDRPFVAMVMRPSLSQPIFVGYLDTDCWKRPQRTSL